MAAFSLSAIIQLVDRITRPARAVAAAVGRAFLGVGKALAGATHLAGSLTLAIMGAGKAVGAVIGSLREYTGEADKIAKTARRLGLTTEALSELRHAGDLSGVTFEELTAGLQKLDVGVSKARIGQGELVAILRKVSPATLQALKRTTSLEEAFTLVAGAAQSIEDPMRRNLFLTAAFAEAGPKFASMFAGGAEGIASMREEAQRLGLSLSGDLATQAEQFNDDVDRLEKSIKGTKNAIFAELLPVLSPLLTDLAKWVTANREIISSRVSEWAKEFIQTLKSFDWSRLVGVVKALAAAIGLSLVGSVVSSIAAFGGLLVGAVVPLVAGMYSLVAAIGGVAAALVSMVAGGIASAITAIGGPLAFALSAARAAFATLNAVILANPIAATVAAMAVAAGLVVAYWEPISEFFVDLWDGIKAGAQSLLDFVTPLFEFIASGIESVVEGLRSVGLLDSAQLDYSGVTVGGGAGVLGAFGFENAARQFAGQAAKIELVARFENAPAGLQVGPPRVTGADVDASTTVRKDLGRSSIVGSPL